MVNRSKQQSEDRAGYIMRFYMIQVNNRTQIKPPSEGKQKTHQSKQTVIENNLKNNHKSMILNIFHLSKSTRDMQTRAIPGTKQENKPFKSKDLRSN